MAKTTQKGFNSAAGLFNDASVKQPTPIIASSAEAPIKTQGKKGHKLPRINMAFTPENHEYVTRVSRQQGISMTDYVNRLITADRTK